MRIRIARLAGVGAAVVLLAGIGIAFAATPDTYAPPCTANTDTCRQQRIVALENHYKGHSHPSPTPSATTATPTPSATPTPTPTPSVTPTPTATGACTGVAGVEGGADPYGTCWPGPSTTGVPAGTALTVVTGNQTYSTANQVVDGRDIRGCVTVTAPGVVIKNSKIACSNWYGIDYFPASTPSVRLLVQDVTISCGGGPGHGIGEKHVDVLRVNISGCENGFDLDSDASVKDSYIHDLYTGNGSDDPHTDGIQSAIGARLTLEHSVWYANNGTAAININNNGTGARDTLINRNLLAGGAYAMYCPRNGSTNYRVIDNRWSRKFYPTGGAFGPWTDCDGEITSGNVWADTGQPI